jgi:hypothetical protein
MNIPTKIAVGIFAKTKIGIIIHKLNLIQYGDIIVKNNALTKDITGKISPSH